MKKLLGSEHLEEKEVMDTNDTMLPIMSLMLILIPVLVGNIAFFHFKNIEVNTPGTSTEPEPEIDMSIAKKDRTVMLQVLVTQRSYEIELIDEDTGLPLDTLKLAPDKKGLAIVEGKIGQYKTSYPKLDTVLITVEENVRYEGLVSILQRFNAARKSQMRKLASTAAVQGKVADMEKEALKLVLIPQGGV